MPYQPLRRCSYPNCKNKVKSGRCEEHKPKDTRASSSARGYNYAWSKYRLKYLRLHPLCVMCLKKGIYTPATVIDHITPVENGQADPQDKSDRPKRLWSEKMNYDNELMMNSLLFVMIINLWIQLNT